MIIRFTLQQKNPYEERGVLVFYMSGLKRLLGFGGKMHIKRNQVLLTNKASRIPLKSGSVNGEVGM